MLQTIKSLVCAALLCPLPTPKETLRNEVLTVSVRPKAAICWLFLLVPFFHFGNQAPESF